MKIRVEVGSHRFVKREDSLLLDLICKRYQGKRPSDYLELSEWDAYQLDVALAMKGKQRETEMIENVFNSMVEVINDGVDTICRALGAKVSRKKKVEPKFIEISTEPLPLSVVLQQLGGKGVVTEYNKKP